MNKYKDPQDIPDSEIPESLDWRNFESSGYDFTSKFRD
jgi:hypothetical protein